MIAADSTAPDRVRRAEEAVAKLRAQLAELQQSEQAFQEQVLLFDELTDLQYVSEYFNPCP